ncbi:MAG: putative lipid II flippase FtsW [Cellvibrionales bacterium TMED49]|nr:putative lipid II flippase FtsW [Porticoccaceae bacterium]OUU38851.1 MAG: putative lipid II flippase FtsW [Cellvibrionales bacterium TMED49]
MSNKILKHKLIPEPQEWYFDPFLFIPLVTLISLGFVMVASASFSFAEHRFGNVFFFTGRHAIYILLAILVAIIAYKVPPKRLRSYGRLWMLFSILMLIAVLIPGIGKELNGSKRWLSFAGLTFQVAEFTKIAVIIFLADYLARHRQVLTKEFSKLAFIVGLISLVAVLLISQPDYGSVVVIGGIFMALLFIGNVRLRDYSILVLLAGSGLWWSAGAAPYRLARLTSFLDPWADQFAAGYQLTQSLIAFGRGEWWGLGLGQSVQKMRYLPEAHTDFVFAIFAEEFGFFGVLILLTVFMTLICRIFKLSLRAIQIGDWYASYFLVGVGLFISGQTFINLGVNAGLLPTKGLTLPFISYGGTSLICCCALMGMSMRISNDLKIVLNKSVERYRNA